MRVRPTIKKRFLIVTDYQTGEKFFSAEQISEILDVHYATVRHYISNGYLNAQTYFGNMLLFSQSEIERFERLVRRRKRGWN